MSERSSTAAELLRTALTFAAVVAIFLVGYAIAQASLGTANPLLVVDGPSMLPTLHEGDYVVIKRVPPSEIKVGDIIVFHNPEDPSKLIIHRVYKILRENPLAVETKGDNNVAPDPWVVEYSMIEGKVILVIPVLGHVTLLLKNEVNLVLVILLLIVLFGMNSLKRPTQRPAADTLG